MNSITRVAVVIGLLVAIGVVMAVRQTGRETSPPPEPSPEASAAVSADTRSQEPAASSADQSGDAAGAPAPAALPRLVDLGAGRCIPCRQMAPILEQLRREFAGRFEVEFIDVWENPAAGQLYGVRMIPTQIFYDAAGKELFRHEGFYGREDILGKWKQLGFDFQK